MGRVVAAAVYSAGKKVTNISLEEGAQWSRKPGHFVWIGLEQPDAQELANLQRHSDHHMHAYKPYPTLEPLPGLQLPTGYAGC